MSMAKRALEAGFKGRLPTADWKTAAEREAGGGGSGGGTPLFDGPAGPADH